LRSREVSSAPPSSLDDSHPLPEQRPDAELIAAIDNLSRGDTELLKKYAHAQIMRVNGTVHAADLKDLMQEAMTRTLLRKRTWNRRVPIVQHLMGCMRSIASDWCKQDRRYTELSGSHASIPSSEVEIAGEAFSERLRSRLQGNSVALSVLETLFDDDSPAVVQKALNISDKAYWAARKRIRRQADRLLLQPKRVNRG
jgi:DNA-directed RNA polymerase specialized sigma24 family protein